jgi:hypothetical protein
MRVGLAAVPAVLFAGGLPAIRCSIQSLPHDLQVEHTFDGPPKHEERITREPLRPTTPAAPVKPFYTFPDHVVVHAMSIGEQAFLRCFHRAQRVDPLLTSAKVQLHLEFDASGAIVHAETSASGALSNCLVVVARHLPWPAPGKHAVVDAPLYFRD